MPTMHQAGTAPRNVTGGAGSGGAGIGDTRPGHRPPRAAGRIIRATALRLLVALTLPAAAAAGPGLEYGSEAEARFLEHCDARGCGCVMERLQELLSYADFVDAAGGGPEAFAAAEDPRLRRALRRAEATCDARVVALR